jgi:hypothetical protein
MPTFGVLVGVLVTAGFGPGKQPIRFIDNNIRNPISRNKSILDLFVINLPLFFYVLRIIDIEK